MARRGFGSNRPNVSTEPQLQIELAELFPEGVAVQKHTNPDIFKLGHATVILHFDSSLQVHSVRGINCIPIASHQA